MVRARATHREPVITNGPPRPPVRAMVTPLPNNVNQLQGTSRRTRSNDRWWQTSHGDQEAHRTTLVESTRLIRAVFSQRRIITTYQRQILRSSRLWKIARRQSPHRRHHGLLSDTDWHFSSNGLRFVVWPRVNDPVTRSRVTGWKRSVRAVTTLTSREYLVEEA